MHTMKQLKRLLLALFLTIQMGGLEAQQSSTIPHLLETKQGVQLIVNGKPYIMLAGELPQLINRE